MIVYRIVSEEEWRDASAAGSYRGSDHDRRDGFIHLSSAAQAAETAAKHYAGRKGLLLLAVDPSLLPVPLKWEPSRGGALFPHLYADLPAAAVVRVDALPLDGDGRFVFPAL